MKDRQDASEAQFNLSPSAWPLYLGKYTPLNARWPETCLLANKPWWLSGIFRDAARKIDCWSWLGVHSPGAFFTISASLLASLYTPAHLTGRDTQPPFVYSPVSLHTHMQIHMHEHTTHTPARFCQNELAAAHVHDIYPIAGSNFHVDETEFTV